VLKLFQGLLEPQNAKERQSDRERKLHASVPRILLRQVEAIPTARTWSASFVFVALVSSRLH